METLVRQSIGIDISKDSFTACLCQLFAKGKYSFSEVRTFENGMKGFNQLIKWVRKSCSSSIPVSWAMEATGTYYEPLAYHLHRLQFRVSVLLPNKVKHYGKSLNVKSKTDAQDAVIIAQMAAERQLEQWQPAAPIFKQLRSLTRLYTDLKAERTAFINRLKSAQAGHEPSAFLMTSLKGIIRKLETEIDKCSAAITKLVKQEQRLQEKVDKLLTIKGIGVITIAIILAETQGFELIANARQLASYAGYDVVRRESGTSVKGKTRISKKGNGRIRAALHFPALVASRYNAALSAVYQRINQGNKASKMIGATALQRKILLLTYAMWKNGTTYKEKQADLNSLPAQDEQKICSPLLP
ncbi:IS110 family transposase [Chitinophaga pollutisoli]|uniref:IS110 family transposase n=1 Tax=Chitinophaga pollutisoli TaxID=3133966 RepID=A0ABZ2YSW9_9BACT